MMDAKHIALGLVIGVAIGLALDNIVAGIGIGIALERDEIYMSRRIPKSAMI